MNCCCRATYTMYEVYASATDARTSTVQGRDDCSFRSSGWWPAIYSHTSDCDCNPTARRLLATASSYWSWRRAPQPQSVVAGGQAYFLPRRNR